MSALPLGIQANIGETTRANSQVFNEDGLFVFPHTALLGVALKAWPFSTKR